MSDGLPEQAVISRGDDRVARWESAVTKLYNAAQDVARLIANTIRAQFDGAAFLVLNIDEDMGERDIELFPEDIRDADGVILYDFESAVLPAVNAELSRKWGDLNPRDAFNLRWLLRQLYIAGVEFDALPLDLMLDHDPDPSPCLLLSERARPRVWKQSVHSGGRLMRPYSAVEPTTNR